MQICKRLHQLKRDLETNIAHQKNPTLNRNDQALGPPTMSSHQIGAALEECDLGQKAEAGPEGTMEKASSQLHALQLNMNSKFLKGDSLGIPPWLSTL